MSIPQSRLEQLWRSEIERQYPGEMECSLRLPARQDGDAAFAKAVYEANLPATLKRPGEGEPTWRIVKRGGQIRIKRQWLIEASEEGTSLTWRLLPRLRKGYLLHFDDDEMVLGAVPPEGATEEEAEAMLTSFAGDELDQVRQRSASLEWAKSEQAQHPEIKAGTRRRPVMAYEHMHAQGVGPTRPQPLNVPDGLGNYQTILTTPGQAIELGRAAADMVQLDNAVDVAQSQLYEQIEQRLDADLTQAQRRAQAQELLALASSHQGAVALADMRARRRRGR